MSFPFSGFGVQELVDSQVYTICTFCQELLKSQQNGFLARICFHMSMHFLLKQEVSDIMPKCLTDLTANTI